MEILGLLRKIRLIQNLCLTLKKTSFNNHHNDQSLGQDITDMKI